MKTCKIGIIFFSLLLLVGATTLNGCRKHTQSAKGASKGPFGFEAGWTKEQVIASVGQNAVIAGNGTSISLRTAPSPRPEFGLYMVSFSDNKLVAILAESPLGSGAAIKNSYDSIGKSITEKYEVKPEEILSADNQWAYIPLTLGAAGVNTEIHDGKTIASYWALSQASYPLVNVYVSANGFDQSQGQLTLGYYFDGYKAK